jgi:uncharacterized protein (DUF2147 family)
MNRIHFQFRLLWLAYFPLFSMKSLLRFSFVVMLLAFFQPVIAQTTGVTGVWFNEEKDTKIEVYKTSGGTYAGKIIWLKDENDKKGQPVTDSENPDRNLRTRRILGMTLMENFTFDGKNTWEGGKIYDAGSGKTYNCKLTLQGRNILDVRGYVGAAWMGLGRTTIWTRAN